ncbi:MAG: imidazole glycerol phosphate synthase subunit HisH [Chitinophagaceae bacterium]|jgi:glutamine amidotransferase|nr:imidazole glycerol phosphate synthase subunit HisH [Chitinophagaceae bacterium]
MELAIIKYNAGNIQSVLYALERIGMQATVTDDPEAIRSAERVIFPGVGEASSAMQYLRERKLDELILGLRQPVLGICLGMQLMCRFSEENNTTCLGIFNEDVRRFQSSSRDFKIPQMGWNTITGLKTGLFQDVPESSYCYFVHSFYASLGPHTIAVTDYIHPYSAGLHRDNFYGVQFHPEKSAAIGEKIIRNFLEI